MRRDIERAARGAAERAERQQRRVADAQRIVPGLERGSADVRDRLVDAQRDVARLLVQPLRRRQRRIDTSIDIPLKHAVAIAVRKQPQLRAVADHLEAHGNRARALQRFKAGALQLAGEVLCADDRSFAFERAADNRNGNRAIIDQRTTTRARDDDVDEARRRGRSVTGRLVGLRRNNDQRLELQEALLADALDVHQVFDPLEAAALGAILDDSLGGLAPDAGQRFQLIDRGGVEVDAPARPGRPVVRLAAWRALYPGARSRWRRRCERGGKAKYAWCPPSES